MQKIKQIGCVILILCVLLQTKVVYADDIEEEEWQESEIQQIVVETAGETVDEPVINSRAAVIYDRETKQVI